MDNDRESVISTRLTPMAFRFSLVSNYKTLRSLTLLEQERISRVNKRVRIITDV